MRFARRSCVALLSFTALAALAAMGCGKLADATEPEAPAASSTPTELPLGGSSRVLTFPGQEEQAFNMTSGDVSRFTFDLSVATKAAAPMVWGDTPNTRTGARYPGDIDSQVWLIGTEGVAEVCAPGREGDLERAAETRLRGHDVVDLSSLRIDIEHTRREDSVRGGVCYGTHQAGGRWIWHVDITPVTIDTPAVFGGEVGTGHVELAINTRNVDAVAIVHSRKLPGMFLKRVTYVATAAER